ncbi:hypothetical protein [Caballeronia sp. KNU42]
MRRILIEPALTLLPNYIVVYRVKLDRIQIPNVLHARRRYPW